MGEHEFGALADLVGVLACPDETGLAPPAGEYLGFEDDAAGHLAEGGDGFAHGLDDLAVGDRNASVSE